MGASPETGRARRPPIASAICGLMALATVAFAAASIIHFGAVIGLGPITVDDPFPGAAIPEAVIAVVLGIGVLSVLTRRPSRWGVALAATLFALLLTIYGLTVTAPSGRTGDITYHVAVLVLSVVIVSLLLLPAGRQSLSR
jgi:hydrogenase/urease accessory protein HupE